MSKYIDAEKLKEHIIKLESDSCISEYKDGFDDGICCVYDTIDTFQQEQPEVDLENYLENYFKGWHIEEEIGLTKPDGWSCIVDDLKELARHFYELGLNARKV